MVGARVIGEWALPEVLIGSLLLFALVGAFILRQSDTLKDQSFLNLVGLVFRSLPLMRGKTKSPREAKPK